METTPVYLLNQPFEMGNFIPVGVWNTTTTYQTGDAVAYNGSSYVSIVNGNINILPTVTSSWMLLAQGYFIFTTAGGALSGNYPNPDLAAQPYLFAQRITSTQAINSSSFTTVVFNGNSAGTAGADTRGSTVPTITNGVVSITTAGLYRISYAVSALASSGTITLSTSLTAGGVIYRGSTATCATLLNGVSHLSIDVPLNAGQAITVAALGSAAGAVQANLPSFATAQTWISVVRVSA